MDKTVQKYKIFNYVLIGAVAIALLTTIWYIVAETFPFGMEFKVNESYGTLTVKILLSILSAFVTTELIFAFIGFKQKRFAKWSGTIGFLSFILLIGMFLICAVDVGLSIIIFVLLGFSILCHSSYAGAYARLPEPAPEAVKTEDLQNDVREEPPVEEVNEEPTPNNAIEKAEVKPKPAPSNVYKKQYPAPRKRKKSK